MSVNEKFLELANKLPEDVQENAVELVERMGRVIEGIGDDPITWKPSYINLVQASSDRDKLPRGAAPGDLVLDENVLEQPLKIIPLWTWFSRQYWDPDHESNQVLCYSPDGRLGLINVNCKQCEFSKYNEELGKSPCSLQITTLNISADLSTIFYITFAKTNYGNGRDFRNMMKKAAVSPYYRMYDIKVVHHPKHKNVEMTKVEPAGKTPTEYREFLQALFEQFGEDRKAHLEDFRKMVAERSQEGTLPQLESLEEVAEGHVLESQSEGQESKAAKNYTL